MGDKTSRTVNYVIFSILFHGTFFAVATNLLTSSSSPKLLPLGTKQDTVIEFTPAAQPLGNQTVNPNTNSELPDVTAVPQSDTAVKTAEIENIVEPQEPTTPPTSEISATIEKKAEKKTTAKTKKAPKAKPAITKSLPVKNAEAPQLLEPVSINPIVIPDESLSKASEINETKLENDINDTTTSEQELSKVNDPVATDVETPQPNEEPNLETNSLPIIGQDQGQSPNSVLNEAQAAGVTTTGSIEQSAGNGSGSANSVDNNATNMPYGVPTGVKDIKDFNQQPGNVPPAYSIEDRLKRREGIVTFLAFVNKDGRLSNFKMKKSSGHRNLDLKTLKSLKDWRFFPGQEGWVEIPFKWSLKGGVEEMPNYLRRGKQQTTSLDHRQKGL